MPGGAVAVAGSEEEGEELIGGGGFNEVTEEAEVAVPAGTTEAFDSDFADEEEEA
jgi:hypothetical protein